jgi:hypothetical protein
MLKGNGQDYAGLDYSVKRSTEIVYHMTEFLVRKYAFHSTDDSLAGIPAVPHEAVVQVGEHTPDVPPNVLRSATAARLNASMENLSALIYQVTGVEYGFTEEEEPVINSYLDSMESGVPH